MKSRVRISPEVKGADLRRPVRTVGVAALGLLLLITGCDGGSRRAVPTAPDAPVVPAVSGDLEMTILSARVDSGRRIVVEFLLRDGLGDPLSLADLDADPRFLFASITIDQGTGYSRYRSHVTTTVAGQDYVFGGSTVSPALGSATQAVADEDGAFTELDAGLYLYVSGLVLPADFDSGATHAVGAYLSRQGGVVVDNEIFHFVPSGETAPLARVVTLTRSCEACHGELAAHGGALRDTGLCVLCHTDQTVDPETGEILEFGSFMHRLHRGEELALKPFLVVGAGQTVHDYSEVVYPQDTRNCQKCHDEGVDGPAQADYWRTQVTRRACGGCHDDADFETGAGHADIPQSEDTFCWICHRPDLLVEFDRSVPGAHVLPSRSSVNPRLSLRIAAVSDMLPGARPTVRFTVQSDAGLVDIASLDRVGITFAGPTSDYSQPISDGRFAVSNGTGALVTHSVGDYSFSPAGYVIPTGATGTWSVGLEARTETFTVANRSFRFGANNPVVHVDLASGTTGGGAPEPRRDVVDVSRCNECHHELRVHDDLRADVEYCVLCHNAWATDEARRSGVDPATNPPESIDFELMIHRIHRGRDLENDYTVFGSGGIPHDFTRVRYPGELADCSACHSGGSEVLPPPPGAVATVRNIGGAPLPQEEAILTPSMAACLGCHDGDVASDHARGFAVIASPTSWEESCSICHGAGTGADASVRHAAQ